MKYLDTIKKWLEEADALVINTGAGMGVDSGLADYRGNGGQWGQVEASKGKSIFEIVNPQAFIDDPVYSWKYFGQRIKEYCETSPHKGFNILMSWIENYKLDYFIMTSNIDGHFQKAGFDEDRIRELHGTMSYFQSADREMYDKIWKNDISGDIIIKEAEKGVFPTCPNSDIPARPNVYMFRDNTYIDTRSKQQKDKFEAFIERNKARRILVFEIGSGPHVQTVRLKTRMLRSKYNANIIRINPKDFKTKPPHIGIAKGALEALNEIDKYLKK